MRSIQKVVIERAEGLTNHNSMKTVTYIGDTAEEQGNQWLREIAQTTPKDGGYGKTDIQVTLSNGHVYDFCFDVKHTSLPDNDIDIRQHMRAWFLYHCRPEELPHIAKDPRRLEYAKERIIPAIKSIMESALALLDADEQKKQKLRGKVIGTLHRVIKELREIAYPSTSPDQTALVQLVKKHHKYLQRLSKDELQEGDSTPEGKDAVHRHRLDAGRLGK